MYRLRTAYGITSIPLLLVGLGTADCLLACLCLHFPCERPRPSLNRSPVTASRAPYQQASCYPNPKPDPPKIHTCFSTTVHWTSSKVAQSIFVFLAVLELTQTSLPKLLPLIPIASRTASPQPLHSRRAAPILLPSALELLLRFAASSFSLLLLLISVPSLLSQRR